MGRTRGSKGGQRGGVTYADSTYGENDKITGAIRDKKFEGFSDLKGAAEKMKQRAHHQQQRESNKDLEDKIILNLQRQIATMETEIKLLKEREVDQKNQASGYETLLRDGIPLNEHFLALKNKFNNEQNDLKNEVKSKEAEIQTVHDSNEAKRNRIQYLKKQYDDAENNFEKTKDGSMKTLKK